VTRFVLSALLGLLIGLVSIADAFLASSDHCQIPPPMFLFLGVSLLLAQSLWEERLRKNDPLGEPRA
jgi:hypothetical protein